MGEYEVYVRMHQFIPLHTRRTRAAGIGLRAVRAADVTGISHSQRKFAYSCRSAEQLRVRNTSFPHLLYQLLFGCILAYYIFKKHGVGIWLINLFGYFLDAVHCTYGIEMDAGNMVLHQFLALLHAPFDTYLLRFGIILAFSRFRLSALRAGLL
mgnify:FL=1